MPDNAGLLDTSVVIDRARVAAGRLPDVVMISAITLAELAQGPSATQDPNERALRQDTLQRAEALFNVLPFDVEAARAFGRLAAAVRATGRLPRRRTVDLQIAAVAMANDLPVYTRNAEDLRGLESLLIVVAV